MARKYITAILCGILVFITGLTGMFGNVDKMIEDVLYHHPITANNNIRIIKIDDKTRNASQQSHIST